MRMLAAFGLVLVLVEMFLPWWEFPNGRQKLALFLLKMMVVSQSIQLKAPLRSILLAQWFLIPMMSLGAGLSLSIRKAPLMLVAASAPMAVVLHVLSLWSDPSLIYRMYPASGTFR